MSKAKPQEQASDTGQLTFEFLFTQKPVLAELPLSARVLTARELAYINGPLVGAGGGWLDTIPYWMREILPTERKRFVIENPDSLSACPLDVVITLYDAALRSPLTREAANVYFSLARTVMQTYKPSGTPWPFEIRPLNGEEQRLQETIGRSIRDRIQKVYNSSQRKTKIKS